MFEGEIDYGELEIGQASSGISEVKPAGAIIEEVMEEFYQVIENLQNLRLS